MEWEESTMKKRVLSAILALCLAVGLLPAGAWAADGNSGKWGELDWHYDDATDTLTISGSGAVPDRSSGEAGPPNLWQVRTVVIEDGVTGIGSSAFEGYNSLTEISIPGSVTSVGECAFANCSGLTRVTFSGGAANIGERAFSSCGALTDVTFSGPVGMIGAGAFEWCRMLAGVTFPGPVEGIGANAFEWCERLGSVTFSGEVGAIGGDAFGQCGALASVNFSGKVGSVASGAFSGCEKLTKLSFPEGVGTIWDYAFQQCGLTALYFKSIDRIGGRDVFSGADELKDIYFGGTQADWATCGGYSAAGADDLVLHTDAAGFPDTGAGDLETLKKLIAAGVGAGRTEIELLGNIDLGAETLEIPKNCNLVLDLKGNTLSSSANPAIHMLGDLTVLDSTVNGVPEVRNDGAVVDYQSGSIQAKGDAVSIQPGRTFTLNGGTIHAEGQGIVFCAGQEGGGWMQTTARINGGFVDAGGSAVKVLEGKENRAGVEIDGGVLRSADAPVVSGSEQEGEVSTNISIRNAALIGGSGTSGRLPCGIYHPQNGSVRVNSTEIYAMDGVGILMRGGSLHVDDDDPDRPSRIHVGGGSGQGTVGGAGTMLEAGHGVVMDQQAALYDYENISVILSKNLTYLAEFNPHPCPHIDGGFGLKTQEDSSEIRYSFGRAYTVTFDAKGGSFGVADGGAGSTKRTTEASGKITGWPADPTREGFQFRGWTDRRSDGSELMMPIDRDNIFNYDTTLYAQWVPDGAYIIEFFEDANNPIPTRTFFTSLGGVLTSWPPCIHGYGRGFAGWYTLPAGRGERYPFDRPFTKDTRLYAYFAAGGPGSYTITFDPNGGSGGDQEHTNEWDGTLRRWPLDPRREGYTFGGWSWSKEYRIVPDDQFTFFDDATLYAWWVKDSGFAVTLDPNGGSGGIQTISTDGSGRVVSWPAPPTLDGYTFGGWYTTGTGSGSRADSSTTFFGDTTLYAYWIKDGDGGKPGPGQELTITFDPNGGNIAAGASTQATQGHKLAALPTPTRAGHTFEGWFTAKEGGEQVDGGTVFTRDATVYARWKQGGDTPDPDQEYTVTFDPKGGELEDGEKTQTTQDHKLAELPEPTREGYTFEGWFTAEEDGERVTADTVFTGDATVYAYWEREYTVTFDPKGGELEDGEKTQTTQDHKLAELPEPTREGYTFEGWFTAEEDGERVTADTVFTGDATVYAYWEQEYTVTFDPNGGELADGEATQITQNKKLATLPTPTREGYTFEGWFAAKEGGQKVGTDSVFAADFTVYARWKQGGDTPNPSQEFTVTFDANGGAVADGEATQTTQNQKLAKLPTPTRADYTFEGWFTAKEGGEPVNTATVFTGNTTVYAHWKQNGGTPGPVQEFTVTFDSQGGSAVPAQKVKAGGKAAQPNPPARSGYAFGGWFRDAACSNAWNFDGDAVNADTTLYARWVSTAPSTPDTTYTVVFHPNGGSGGTSLTTGSGGRLSALPAAPTRPGYVFGGWFTHPSGGSAISTSTVFSRDTTVYAHWIGGGSPSIPSAYYQIYAPSAVYGGSYSISHTAAAPGTSVTVTLQPHSGFEVRQLSVRRLDNALELYVFRDYSGRYTFTMPDSNVELTISCVQTYTGGGSPGWAEPPASAGPVDWYFANGRIYHVNQGAVPAASRLTRDMLVSVLYNMDGGNTGSPTDWAVSNGVIPDIFHSELWGTDRPISREQAAMILFGYAKYKGYDTSRTASLSGFTDYGQIRAVARPAMAWCRAVGVIAGTSERTLSPRSLMDCSQANTVLSRFLSNVART